MLEMVESLPGAITLVRLMKLSTSEPSLSVANKLALTIPWLAVPVFAENLANVRRRCVFNFPTLTLLLLLVLLPIPSASRMFCTPAVINVHAIFKPQGGCSVPSTWQTMLSSTFNMTHQ